MIEVSVKSPLGYVYNPLLFTLLYCCKKIYAAPLNSFAVIY